MDHEQNAMSFMVAGGVNLPVAGATPGLDGARALGDGHAERNVAFGVFAADKTPAHAFAMALWKKGNEVSSVGVEPLIDGLVADGKSGAVAADAACDEFGRPAQTELGLDIGAQ